MLHENSHESSQEKSEPDLEKRLTEYYGPLLPPHHLPESAWFRLKEQMHQEHPIFPCRRIHLSRLHRPASQRAIPFEVQETFVALLQRVQYRSPYPKLRCTSSSSRSRPRVSVSPLGRGQVKLRLPSQAGGLLRQEELDVLIAAGLARCSGMLWPLYLLPRVFFACALLLTGASFSLTIWDRRFIWLLFAAAGCCLAVSWLLCWRGRVRVFQGDRQAVYWLGRERVCRGLHLLAERERSQHLSVWGEPSLTERISRVCGTGVVSEDRHLTMVR